MAAPTFIAATRPAVGWTGSTTRTTPSFNVTAGDVLVVLAGTEDTGYTLNTPTGGSLTWTQQENASATGWSRSGIWTATAASTTSITVSVTAGGGVTATNIWGFVVHQYSNASIGAHTSATQAAGTAPSLALTTTAANSAISYIDVDWSAANGATRTWRTINSITPTAGNGFETDYYRDAGGAQCALYVAYWSDVGATGAKTTGISTPTQKPTIAVIEIKGTGAAAGPVAKKIIMNRQALVRSNYW